LGELPDLGDVDKFNSFAFNVVLLSKGRISPHRTAVLV